MTAKKKLSWDDIKKRRKRATVPIVVQLDGNINAEIKRLNEELTEARLEDRRHEGELDWEPRALEIAQRIIELQSEATETEAEFVMGEVARAEWNVLLRTHGPTAQQRKEGQTNFNPETFIPAALAASAVNPPLTKEQAEELCADWSEGQVQRVFGAVLEATMGDRTPPKSTMASEVIREFGAGSELPSDAESPLPSSMDA